MRPRKRDFSYLGVPRLVPAYGTGVGQGRAFPVVSRGILSGFRGCLETVDQYLSKYTLC